MTVGRVAAASRLENVWQRGPLYPGAVVQHVDHYGVGATLDLNANLVNGIPKGVVKDWSEGSLQHGGIHSCADVSRFSDHDDCLAIVGAMTYFSGRVERYFEKRG